MNWITTAKKRVKKRKDFSDGISKNRHLASTNIDSIQRHPQINNSQFAPSLSSAFSSQIKQNNSISNDGK